jgi:hypothetical protein
VSLPTIDFSKLRRHRTSQNDAFEELTRQLIAADPPIGCIEIENRGAGADGGVEVLVRFDGGRVWGWQSKFFLNRFGDSEVSQLKKSFRSALKAIAGLERYTVAIPRNLAGAGSGGRRTQRTKWDDFVAWAQAEAEAAGKMVAIELWDETHFFSKLQSTDPKHAGMRAYWFDQEAFTGDWFSRQLNIAKRYIGKRYRAEDHVDLQINNPLRLLRRTDEANARFSLIKAALEKARQQLESLSASDSEEVSGPAALLAADVAATIDRLKDAGKDKPNDVDLCSVLEDVRKFGKGDERLLALRNELYRRRDKDDEEGDPTLSEYHHPGNERHSINFLLEHIWSASNELTQTEIELLGQPRLLILGEAGTGKSHLLAEEASRHVEAGYPAIFVPARAIESGDQPAKGILEFLDLGDLRFDVFLAAMNAAAMASGKPALLIVDGLNETALAAGWSSGLPTLIERVSSYECLALCVSVRSTYQKLCVRDDLELPTLRHRGFVGELGKAAKEYLDRHGIERPSAPIFGLSEVLYNPLFLSTAVDALKSRGETSFPRDLDDIEQLIKFWLDSIERTLVEKGFERIELGAGKVGRVLRALGSEMAKLGSESMAEEEASDICESIVGLALPTRPAERLIQRLLDEGVLLDFPDANTKSGKSISFGFQKFSDYFVADAIINSVADQGELAQSLKRDGRFAYLFEEEGYYRYGGVRSALMSLLPTRMGVELPYIEDKFPQAVSIRVSEFLGSLPWRSAESITQETVDLLERLRGHDGDSERAISDHEWYDLLLQMAVLPNCMLNANFLKEELAGMPMPERDASWSAYLVGRYTDYEDDWSPVYHVIDWAWVAPKTNADETVRALAATTMALCTSSTDRTLRDSATKGLSSLLIHFPDQIPQLLREFSDWDDAYVRERVLAAAMAGTVYCAEPTILTASAAAVDAMVFARKPVERHAWIRRYAQIIIDHATANGAVLATEVVERSRPPYGSQPIVEWPTLEDIGPKYDSAPAIFSSVVGMMSKPYGKSDPIMAGDFGRYTMGSIDNCFSQEVRVNGRRPETRERIIELFWADVQKWDEQTAACREPLADAYRAKEAAYFGNLARSLKSKEREAETDQPVSEFEVLERDFVSKLDGGLRERYQDLRPFETFRGRGIPMFSLRQGQCWVVQRALDLGWREDLHGQIEKDRLAVSYDRTNHRVERIGKKYQHIAFAELTGYLVDHHWYTDYDDDPQVLQCLEQFERPDIDPTFLAGSNSAAAADHDPGGIVYPVIDYTPSDAASNEAWAESASDLPSPIPFLVQRGGDGFDWCVTKSFARNADYMHVFNSDSPMRSCQYSIELIFVAVSDLERLARLDSEAIDGDDRDVFEHAWPTREFFGQRRDNHLTEVDLSLEWRVAGIDFARMMSLYSPKQSEFDCSGTREEADFWAPNQALIKCLGLFPESPWSRLFVDEHGRPAFVDQKRELFDECCLARYDLVAQFAANNNVHPVWRVWAEKDGGMGTLRETRKRSSFKRRDYIGFFFSRDGSWSGQFVPYRH